MLTADADVLSTAAAWLDAGHAVWLVTVASTAGSAPRPHGSLMAVRDDARFVGSVSGGCVEDDLAARLAARVLAVDLPRVETYGVTAAETARFGLPCGGQLDLVIERLSAAAPVRAILAALEARQPVVRRLCLATGEASLHPARPVDEFTFDGATLSRTFGPRWRLLLVGAGQLARFTAELGLMLGYEVIVCDPREEYAAAWQVPGTALDTRDPDAAVREQAVDARTAVVTLAHVPELDDPALVAALRSPAFYVGALGSRANHAKRCLRLAALGVNETELERLHAPVGLPIGAATPAEIALSILAEITAVRAAERQRGALPLASRAGGD